MPLVGKVDVVMVHEPALIAKALEELELVPPEQPLVFVVGHTHKPTLTRRATSRSSTAARSAAAARATCPTRATDVGLARLSYSLTGGFRPLAADLVGIDPGSGAATARRARLDEPGSE